MTTAAPVHGPGNGDDEPAALSTPTAAVARVGTGVEAASRGCRGAGVQIDTPACSAGSSIGLVLATLAVLVVVFTVVGVHKNQQDDRLHNDGVPVTFTRERLPGAARRERQQRRRLLVPRAATALDGHTLQRAAARQRLPPAGVHRARHRRAG